MKYLWMLLLFVVPVMAQDHAPLIKQCRVDVALWTAKDDATQGRGFNSLTDYQLSARATEMLYCRMNVDSAHSAQYDNMYEEFIALEMTRMIHFLQRHGHWNQYISEDAAGAR